MLWSASVLVKNSARKILYDIENPAEKVVTPQMKAGVKSQAGSTLPGSLSEMRAIFSRAGESIAFTVDEIRPYLIVEHKMSSYDSPSWYIESSLIQAAFYKSMIELGATSFKTASFMIQKGYPAEVAEVSRSIDYAIKFSHEERLKMIHVSSPRRVVDFYFSKIDAINNGWSSAQSFDNLHKRREFSVLSPYFSAV